MKGTPIFVLTSIVVLTIAGAVSLSPAYACTFNGSLSSPTITQGASSVTVSGTDDCGPPGSIVVVYLYPGACSALTGNAFSSSSTTTDSNGHFSQNIPTSSLTPGPYCVNLSTPSGCYGGLASGCVNDDLTVFQPATMMTQTYSLPPAIVLQTDWTIVSVAITPSNPQPGEPVTLSAVLVALSSNVAFPQSVDLECTIDGMPCGGGTVSYPGPAGNPATVSAQTPWTATPGTHTLTWSVSTNFDPNPSNNVLSSTFTVGPIIQTTTVQTTTQPVSTSTQPVPDFTIRASPPSQSALQGQTVSYLVNVTALNGFNSQVSLSVSGLPSGANGVFSNPSATPNFASTLTVTLPTDVSIASYTLTVTGSGGGLTHVANLVLTVNAAATTQTSASSAETSASSTQTSSDLMSIIQQNQLLILGAVILLAAVIIAVALRGRRKPTPTQPTRTGATTGMVYCGKCGTQNPTANEFCATCGTKLH